MRSSSGLYEDAEGWGQLADVFQDCVPEPDSVLDENLLVTFIKEQKDQAHIGAAKLVAEWSGDSFKDLFPYHWECDQTVLKEKANKKIAKAKVVVEEIPDNSQYCIDLHKYDVLDQNWYFMTPGDKYSEAMCMRCKKWFNTPSNIDKGRNPELEVPGSGRSAYVCPGMTKDLCRCGKFICSACHAGLGKPKRGGR